MVDLVSVLPLIHNGALLLALAFVYDVLVIPAHGASTWRQQVLLGVGVGLIGLLIMLTPWQFTEGVVFDMRSVLLAVSGLFFGLLPTVVAMAMTAVLRLAQGGAGAWTGVAVIVATGCAGMSWRLWRKPAPASLGWGELYLFGLVVQGVALALLLTLPGVIGQQVLRAISLPVLLIYPVVTALLGRLLVTRQRRELAVTALRQTEAAYRDLYEQAPDMFLSVDAATARVIQCNETLTKVIGYSKEEIIGRQIADLYHPDSLAAFRNAYDTFATTGEVHNVEMQVCCQDGSRVSVILNATAVRDSGGKILYSRSIWRDITGRKAAEAQAEVAQAALRQSEERFRHVASSISDIAFSCVEEVGREYTLDWMTGAAERMTGYSVAEIMAMGCWGRLVVAADRPLFAAQITELATNAAGSCELRLRHRTGAVVWIEATAECVVDGQGRRLYGALVDITARKQVEAALRQSEEKALALLNAPDDAAFLVDPQGCIIALNRELVRRSGCSEQELLGASIFDLFSSTVAEVHRTQVDQVLRTRQPLRFADQRNGIFIENSIYPILDATGEVVQCAIYWRDVTHQRQAEERYQTLFREMLDGFALHEIICDEQGQPIDYRFLAVNPAFERLTGLTAAAVVGRTVLEVLPATAAYWIETYGRVALTGMPEFLENFSQATARYYEVTAFSPAPKQFATIFADVTERRRAELALERRDALLEALSYVAARFLQLDDWEQAMPDVLARLGAAAQVSRVYLFQNETDLAGELITSQRFEWRAPGVCAQIDNPSCQRASYGRLGFARWAEVLAQGQLIRGQTRDLPMSERALLMAQDVQSLVAVPIHVQRRWWGFVGFEQCDFEYTWSDAEIEALRAAAHALGAAIENQASRDRLQQQTEQLVQIMGSVPEGLVLLDLNGQVLSTNPSAAAHLQLLTGAAHWSQIDRLGNQPLRLLLSAPATGMGHRVQAGQRTFDILAHPVESGPTPLGWVLVTRDVTEELATQQQLHRQGRLAAIGQLAAGIAHDFNNLMSVIILYAQLTAQAPGLGLREQERLGVIEQQAQRGVRMIRQILDFSRRTVLERQPLDLLPLLKEQVKLLERTLPEHIIIRLQQEGADFVVQADPTRIEQVVMNLVVNARDAMPEGGLLTIALAQVQFAASKETPLVGMPTGAWVRLSVTDTGAGIAAEVMEHMFEPFFTTKAPGLGTGLGLAQVHGIVAQHDGYVVVASEVGKGAAFTIYLPALAVISPGMAATPDLVALVQGHGETILVVEDDPALRGTLVELLSLWNYHTSAVANGKDALALIDAERTRFGLILSDVVMPEMSGMALFQALRQRALVLPMILLTGHALSDELESMRQLGLYAWLPKPPGADQLAQTIAAALRSDGGEV